jgi:hypothetical protein
MADLPFWEFQCWRWGQTLILGVFFISPTRFASTLMVGAQAPMPARRFRKT